MADNEITLDKKDPAEEAPSADKSKKAADNSKKAVDKKAQKAAEKAKKAADKAKKAADEGPRPPLLIEFAVTASVILLVVVFLTIAGISLINGASLIDFVIRTSISTLALGCLLLIITRQISIGIYSPEAAPEEEEKKVPDESEPPQTPVEVQ
jgi:hypothetical protein